jgi:hypothetical protein
MKAKTEAGQNIPPPTSDKADPPAMPHERDESATAGPIKPQKDMKQAYKDLQRGLVDTDMHGARGVEEVVKSQVGTKQ